VAFVSEDLLRWSLAELRGWSATVAKRGRQTFPRFLVLKRLGVPPDGAWSEVISTADFSRKTEELFGVASEANAEAAGAGSSPMYLNPLTGDYPKAAPSDWAIGTLWTRSRDDDALKIDVQGTGGNNLPRKFKFVDDYVSEVWPATSAKIPLLPLTVFLARRSKPWGGPEGFTDLAQLREAVVAGLNLTGPELEALFSLTTAPGLPLAEHELSEAQVLSVAQQEMPPATPKSDAPGAAGGQAASAATVTTSSSGPDWTADSSGDDPCDLKGLGPALRKAQAALAAGKHVIFYGPPGTGKSRLAECLCRALGVKYLLTTATADWTTFDTIGGYFPEKVEGQEKERLTYVPGILVEAIAEKSWVIIDEINRADIDKAFGPLFSVLAGQRVRLPFYDRMATPPFRVSIGPASTDGEQPTITVDDDWRLIGTMNTFDKASLFQLSYALMRRFAFVEVAAPDGPLLAEILAGAMDVWPDDGRAELGERLMGVFTASTGLKVAGCEVGAAIPLDVFKAIGLAPTAILDNGYLLELLDMYLFPQFEGMERNHKKIFDAIKSTLELDEATSATLQRKLSGWTGHP
jgi:hypothetical protein